MPNQTQNQTNQTEFLELNNAMLNVFNNWHPLKQLRCVRGFEALSGDAVENDLKDFYADIAVALKRHAKPVKQSVAAAVSKLEMLLDMFPAMSDESRAVVIEGLKFLSENGATAADRRFGSEIIKLLEWSLNQFNAAENILDLSNSSIEDLSQKLSDIVQNPLLPESIHDCIVDHLADMSDTRNINSPEAIKTALLSQQKTTEK